MQTQRTLEVTMMLKAIASSDAPMTQLMATLPPQVARLFWAPTGSTLLYPWDTASCYAIHSLLMPFQ